MNKVIILFLLLISLTSVTVKKTYWQGYVVMAVRKNFGSKWFSSWIIEAKDYKSAKQLLDNKIKNYYSPKKFTKQSVVIERWYPSKNILKKQP